MPRKVTLHPIQAQRFQRVERLKAEMERKREEYGEAVNKYVEAKTNLEATKE